jgi:hypothetical protein
MATASWLMGARGGAVPGEGSLPVRAAPAQRALSYRTNSCSTPTKKWSDFGKNDGVRTGQIIGEY